MGLVIWHQQNTEKQTLKELIRWLLKIAFDKDEEEIYTVTVT